MEVTPKTFKVERGRNVFLGLLLARNSVLGTRN